MHFELCLLLICAAAILANPVEHKSWQVIIGECATENGYDPTVEPSDEIENCAIACTMKRLGTMSEDNFYLPEKIIEVLPKDYDKYDEIVAAMRTCSKTFDKNPCDTVAVVRHCLSKNLPCDNEYACNIASYQFLFYDPNMTQEDIYFDQKY